MKKQGIGPEQFVGVRASVLGCDCLPVDEATPVIVGTGDSTSEAVSVGIVEPGEVIKDKD